MKTPTPTLTFSPPAGTAPTGFRLFSMVLAVVLAALFILWPASGYSQTRCLDYWATGPSKCKKEVVEKKKQQETAEQPQAELVEPEKDEEEMTEEEKKEAKLQKDIDKFYNRHGKPPEEFVRFYMDPSPANAIAWVKKYNENLGRSRELSAAWTQAQKIYDRFKEKGMDLPPEMLPEYAREDENALPPVQDLGEELPPSLQGVFGGGQKQAPLQNQQAMAEDGLGFDGGGVSVQVGEDGRIGGNLPADALTNGAAASGGASDASSTAGGSSSAQGGKGPVEISYYFSAECPYCEKFEPVFREVLAEMGGNVDVTCVDMTPSGQTQANIHGKIDCEWRPLLEGEMQAMGIEATPTLIVDLGKDKPLERLSGFVDEKRLRRYFKKKKVL